MSKNTSIKTGDEVVVISGKARNVRAKVVQVLPSIQKVVLERIVADEKAAESETHVRPAKRHVRKSQEQPEGAIVVKEMPIHVSNVMKADIYDKSRAAKK